LAEGMAEAVECLLSNVKPGVSKKKKPQTTSHTNKKTHPHKTNTCLKL
jgi:hypothetical protein